MEEIKDPVLYTIVVIMLGSVSAILAVFAIVAVGFLFSFLKGCIRR